MQGNSSTVSSNQVGMHNDLDEIVKKHLQESYQQPYRDFSLSIFDQVNEQYKKQNRPIIFDSGCGTGESSLYLAKTYPDHLVIGIDKSRKRLAKQGLAHDLFVENNLILVQADLIDFWRLAVKENWKLARHYLLYPNPWPKKQQLKRRWHGHPIFPTILELGGILELRSNWQIYVNEFAQALRLAGISNPSVSELCIDEAISPFELKYLKSDHSLFRLNVSLES